MAPVEIEDIDVTIKLANRDTISPIGIPHKMTFVPLYLVDPS